MGIVALITAIMVFVGGLRLGALTAGAFALLIGGIVVVERLIRRG